MTWTWALLTATGTTLEPPAEFADELKFPSQSDAETWIGEVWQDLLEAGVDAVDLYDGDVRIYGPMSLHPGPAAPKQ